MLGIIQMLIFEGFLGAIVLGPALLAIGGFFLLLFVGIARGGK